MPASYVQAFVVFPRLQLSATVDFLIDTGADNTCLHPSDIVKLSIDYRKLKRVFSSSGRETGGEIQGCVFDIHICHRTASNAIQGLPSLLGRDFLNLCAVQMDKSRNRVTLEPLNVHESMIMPPNIPHP